MTAVDFLTNIDHRNSNRFGLSASIITTRVTAHPWAAAG
jgi:hypothetical protein